MTQVTKIKTSVPTVVLIGRANVGKSSLFNKLSDMRKALVSPIAGTTRDTNEAIVTWGKGSFRLIDTGGIETIVSTKTLKKLAPKANEAFAKEIIEKSIEALKEADIMLFVVDFKTGILPPDFELAKSLKKIGKPIILLVNKTDSFADQVQTQNFLRLGINEIITTSALRGHGMGDLLDLLVERVKDIKPEAKFVETENVPDLRVALIGKPNVGKSSLFNKLIGEEKAIISPIPHTTREAKDTLVKYGEDKMLFVDTAGLRKSAKVQEGLEEGSVAKTLSAIHNADVAIFMIDVSQPITTQDKKIGAELMDSNINVLIVANKWDLIEKKSTQSQKEFTDEIYYELPFLFWAPVHFVSAKTGKGVSGVYEEILKINRQRFTIIPADELEKFIKSAIKRHRPETDRGIMPPKILGFEQITTNPPRFVLHIRQIDRLSESYLRYIENRLREKFDLTGTKVWISVKK